MLLRKIDGEMNVQNCGFFAKWRRWQYAPRLTATAVITDSRHRFLKRWYVADVKNIADDDQTTLMVHQNSANIWCTFRFYVCLHLRDRDCPAADGSGSCRAPHCHISKRWHIANFKNFTIWWPGNPNGRSKFRNLGLFTFTQTQLTLHLRFRGWWRLPEIAQTARNRRQRHRRDDQDRSKLSKYENLCLWYQEKHLKIIIFAATNDAAIDGIAHRSISCYHSQRLCFHIRKRISWQPWPPHRKTEIYIL